MQSFSVCANALLPLFLVMIVGYVCKRLKWVRMEDIPTINKLAMRVFLPIMLFNSILKSDLTTAVQPRLMAFGGLTLIGCWVVSALVALLFVRDASKRGVLVHAMFRPSYSIIALPIAEAMCPGADMSAVTVILAIVILITNSFGVLSLTLFSGQKLQWKETSLSIAKNPLIIATLLGVVFVGLGISLPTTVTKAIGDLAKIATPLLLFLLGASFNPTGLKSSPGYVALATFGKLILLPAIFLTVAYFFGYRGVEFAAFIGLYGSSTSAVSYSMASAMGADDKLAGDCVVSTTFFSCFTMFGWCLLGSILGII